MNNIVANLKNYNYKTNGSAPVISFIVPIYNVENYLERCIKSIQKQTFTNIEILLVDDGSPDNCPKMCDEYAETDDRIRVIHKRNGGLSDARNVGIDFSVGKYLIFIDSDDWIDADMAELLYKMCTTHNVPIAECSYRNIYNDRIIEETACSGEIIKADAVFALEAMLDWKYFKPIACNKIYERILFDNIRYPIGKLHEDEFTTYKLLWEAKEAVFIDVSKYNYDRTRENAITSTFKEKNLDVVFAFKEKLDFIEQRNIDKLLLKTAENYCWVAFDRLTKCYYNNISGNKVDSVIKLITDDKERLCNIHIDAYYKEQLVWLKNGYNEFINNRIKAEGGQ